MILVYSDEVTPRLEYIVNVFFTQIYSSPFSITNNQNDFIKYDGVRINYAAKKNNMGGIFIAATNLLFTNIIDAALKPTIENDSTFETPFFFKTNQQESAIPFDIFAASFYLITRYEEYIPHVKDEFEYFEAKESIAYKNNFLNMPLINIWAMHLKKIIEQNYPNIKIDFPIFESTITIDVDQAYAYRHRGFYRNFLAFSKNCFTFNFSQVIDQIKTLCGYKNDNYDTFEYLKTQQAKNKLPFLYFFNLGKYSRFDKNLSSNNYFQQKLIKNIAISNIIGIHPSYYSNVNNTYLTNEIAALKNIVQQPIIHSRQHFIRLFFPSTYKQLINENIKNDYSMGYATLPGFRASICTPFLWFNLQTNKSTHLTVYPFAYMDGHLAEDLKLTPTEAWVQIENLIKAVKKVNGHFITIWHNTTVNNIGTWKNWQPIFEKTLSTLRE
jgi:hypothetical protein